MLFEVDASATYILENFTYELPPSQLSGNTSLQIVNAGWDWYWGTTRAAQGITTGDNGAGYMLTAVTIKLANSIGVPERFSIQIFSEENGRPGAFVESLTGEQSPVLAGRYSYASDGDLWLAPNTYYYVVASAPLASPSPPPFLFAEALWHKSEIFRYDSSDGWEVHPGGYFSHNDGPWQINCCSGPMVLGIEATPLPVPEPPAYASLGIGLIIMAGQSARRRLRGDGRDAAKHRGC